MAEPGIYFYFPILARVLYRIDLRIITYIVPLQKSLTKDNIPVEVDAVVFYQVADPKACILNVDDYHQATQLGARTAIRDMVGRSLLAELLADRVTGIDAKPGVHSSGVMWTETDVSEDSWYLNRGRMPAGIMIESGQADLMLISYMGADFLNQGERVYRLLGCELTYEDDLPKPGDTLCYEIHVDGHARQDDVRLFFFHYECLVAGQPRNRQYEQRKPSSPCSSRQ